MKVLTFGEIMLRLKAPGHERFFQSPSLEATFGRCDVAVCDMSNAKYQASLDSNFIATGISGRPQNYGAGVQKGDQEWLNYVNTVLQDAMCGATYQSYIDAYEQWFGVKLDPPQTGKPGMYR